MSSTPQTAGPPPWLDPSMQQRVRWRDRDIVISVPIKSGTTWTMNIVHQLLSGGDPDFEDIYSEVPWIEVLRRPGMPVEELLARLEAMPLGRARAFKTHSAPPMLPYIETGRAEDVRYIVVCRSPEEALVSMKPFLEKHSDEWYELWKTPKGALTRRDFPTFYREVVDVMGMQGMLFGFLAAWWPLRRNKNVLLVHFADMKRDHEGSIRRIAEFIGTAPSPEEWARILEYTSFPWMKTHAVKFDGVKIADVPLLVPGAMVRKGEVGTAREDGMTPEIAGHLREVGRRLCPDDEAIAWLYEGGPVPGVEQWASRKGTQCRR